MLRLRKILRILIKNCVYLYFDDGKFNQHYDIYYYHVYYGEGDAGVNNATQNDRNGNMMET